MDKVVGVLLLLLPAVFGNGIARFEVQESRDVAVPEIVGDVPDTDVAVADDDEDASEDRTSCPYGFSRYRNYCFHASDHKANWMDASVYCAAYDAHLAVLDSSYKQSALQRIINNQYQHHAKPSFWIGGTDVLWNHRWVWYGGNKMTYSNWYPGRPRNYGNCLYLVKKTFKWYDVNCAAAYYFICESKLHGRSPVE